MASSVSNTVGLGLNPRSQDSYNSNNRTDSSLASGMTKKDFSSPTSSSVSESIARANYQSLTLSNSKVIELRKYVYKMVSMWSYEDKSNIISQYGDSALLGKDSSEDLLNKQCTETLIINMRQQDLEILLKDIKVDERAIKKEVQQIRNKKKKASAASGQFHTGSFNDVYASIEKANSPKDIRKYLTAYNKSFKIPKKVTKQFGKLKKELEKVLKEVYNPVEVAGLAYNMEIDIEDGSSFKVISGQIINKVLLYVSLIMGKSNTMYASGIVRGVKQYNELLQYTSYGFITGEAGLSPKELTELKQNAKLAKVRSTEGFKAKSRQTQVITNRREAKRDRKGINRGGTFARGVAGIGLGLGAGVFGAIGGKVRQWQSKDDDNNYGDGNDGAREGFGTAFQATRRALMGDKRNTYRDMKKARAMVEGKGTLSEGMESQRTKLEELYSNTLDGENKNTKQDRQKFLQMAQDQGIKTTGRWGKKYSDKKVANALLSTAQEAENRVAKLEKKKKKDNARGVLFKDQAALDAAKETANMFGEKDGASSGDKIPYTYIQGTVGGNDLKKEITGEDPLVPVYVTNQLTSIGEKMSGKLFDPIFDGGSYERMLPVYVANQITNMGVKLSGPMKRDDFSNPFDFALPVYVINQTGSTSDEDSEEDVTKVDDIDDIINATADISIIELAQGQVLMDEERRKIEEIYHGSGSTKSKDYISKAAQLFGIKKVKKESAKPVYVVNDMLNVITRADAEPSKIEELIAKASKAALTGAFGPIVGPAVGKVLGLASGGYGKALPRFASGTSSSSSSSMSQFIAGDSLNGKPNEEQVSIDWGKKSFQVKPVPSMSKGELASGGISSATKMSTSDRNAPMSVGISSHTVTYTRDLMFVKEQGQKQAIKVMAVNPGIYDKVDYEGNTLSLMDVIAEMSMKITSLETAVNTGNTQRNAVIANTGATLQNIAKLGSSGSSSSPFTNGGFTSAMDSILQGQ